MTDQRHNVFVFERWEAGDLYQKYPGVKSIQVACSYA